MHLDEKSARDSISCALLRGYGTAAGSASEREAAALRELEQLRKLRALQNHVLCDCGQAPAGSYMDLAAYFEELFTAAELCIAGSGYNLQLKPGDGKPAFGHVNSRTIAHAAMNLLANALIYSTDKTARVSLESGKDLLLRAENNGEFDWRAVSVNMEKCGRGLCAVRAAARAHGGRLWLTERRGICTAALILPLSAADGATPIPPPDCADLLFDRVSSVHTGLADIR
ncbi:MAG: ATP-binding protein [Oscillospiraceae bacterium]|jgi:signal transduction histidine kinase|nr:ATP-binding protein [Oscillospiraceae bacterium]